jgi:hypothetical protein
VTGLLRQPRDYVLAALGVAGLAILLWNVLSFASVCDDAFISFRYLDNWLAGDGLVYNPGERVEGYTNFLWIVLLAPLRILGLEPELAAHTLSGLSLGVLLWATFLTARRLSPEGGAGWAALILAATSVPLAHWTSSGMETAFYAALLALANERLAARGQHTLVSSVWFGLALLTRPEALAMAGLSILAALPGAGHRTRATARKLAGPVVTFLAFTVAHTAFRLVYYGAPLPNTFYAKLSGDLPSLIPYGLAYLGRFVQEGGFLLLIPALLALRKRYLRSWIVWALILQVLFQFAYSMRVGGDYFPFHRFLVPIIPQLAILGGLGLSGVFSALKSRPVRQAPATALVIGALGAWIAAGTASSRAFSELVKFRAEHEAVAEWLAARTTKDTLLAVNVAGRIPYRTGLPTVDMLGLNDRHIAKAAADIASGDGYMRVGHFKHDGAYVCSRLPGVVVTSGGALHAARHADEAIIQAALNTFPGDREFLRDRSCQGRYEPVAQELSPGRFAVAYFRVSEPQLGDPLDSPRPGSAEEWFNHGLALMAAADLEQAIQAFRTSLELVPDNTVAMTNLGFCLLDLRRNEEAAGIFRRALALRASEFNAIYGLAQALERLGRTEEAVGLWRRYIAEAPDTVWKDRARDRLFVLTGSRD